MNLRVDMPIWWEQPLGVLLRLTTRALQPSYVFLDDEEKEVMARSVMKGIGLLLGGTFTIGDSGRRLTPHETTHFALGLLETANPLDLRAGPPGDDVLRLVDYVKFVLRPGGERLVDGLIDMDLPTAFVDQDVDDDGPIEMDLPNDIADQDFNGDGLIDMERRNDTIVGEDIDDDGFIDMDRMF